MMLGTSMGPGLEPNILNFETLMHNFTSLSTISPNFRTICPVVTENLSRQNLDREEEVEEKEEKQLKILIIIILTRYDYNLSIIKSHKPAPHSQVTSWSVYMV